MNGSAPTPPNAWFPLTPRGVAAFATTRLGRLWLVQFVFALLAAAAFGWFLHTAWTPVLRDAIDQLPDDTQISGGVLKWTTHSPAVLAEGAFLALVVDLDQTGAANSTAQVQVTFGKHTWEVTSLLGALYVPRLLDTTYPANYTIAFNRSELGPWWGAREPFLVVLAMAGLVVFLMLSWFALATLYFIPVWVLGFFANRALDKAGAWRMAGAALMPGALFLSVAIVLYGLRAFDLLKLGMAFGVHLVVGWIYVFISPIFLPRHPKIPPAKANPFNSTANPRP